MPSIGSPPLSENPLFLHDENKGTYIHKKKTPSPPFLGTMVPYSFYEKLSHIIVFHSLIVMLEGVRSSEKMEYSEVFLVIWRHMYPGSHVLILFISTRVMIFLFAQILAQIIIKCWVSSKISGLASFFLRHGRLLETGSLGHFQVTTSKINQSYKTRLIVTHFQDYSKSI